VLVARTRYGCARATRSVRSSLERLVRASSIRALSTAPTGTPGSTSTARLGSDHRHDEPNDRPGLAAAYTRERKAYRLPLLRAIVGSAQLEGAARTAIPPSGPSLSSPAHCPRRDRQQRNVGRIHTRPYLLSSARL